MSGLVLIIAAIIIPVMKASIIATPILIPAIRISPVRIWELVWVTPWIPDTRMIAIMARFPQNNPAIVAIAARINAPGKT
jgi:hypothetical protein